MRIGLYMIMVTQFFTPPYQRTASYSSKVNYTLELTHLPACSPFWLLVALPLPSGNPQSFRWIAHLALSSGAWTRAFGFTVQKLHLPFTPLSKIDVPRPFHGLLHLHSRYTLGKSIRSVAFPRHMDNLQVSH